MSRIKKLYKPFQRWQKSGNIIIFSDPHWFDEDCQLMNKDWITPYEHMKRLCKDIHSSDTLVCLGDVGDPKVMNWIKAKRNNLHTVLIMGNHDKHSQVDEYFDEVYEGTVMIAPQIILSHEPVKVPWALNVHGHCHGAENICEKDEDGIVRGINLASDVVYWQAFNLNSYVNGGGLKNIKTIHRLVIDEGGIKNDKINRL